MKELTPEESVLDSIKEDLDAHEERTLSAGVLTPRHRRLCQLAAAGASNSTIMKELGYTAAWVSNLLKNQQIIAEIHRLQDRIFEKTVQDQFKDLVEVAVRNVRDVLEDDTGRVKPNTKLAASQWLIEMTAGKAVQRTDIGENTTKAIIALAQAQNESLRRPQSSSMKDVTPAKEEEVEQDDMEVWLDDFVRRSKQNQS